MDANGRESIESELTHQIVGCAMTVLNELGHGFREKTYERALCVEFRLLGLPFHQQHGYPVVYRGEHIDDYIPDLEIDKRLIVEVKTVEKINDEHIVQVINYLKVTGLQVGVILNFKRPRLEWRKIVLQEARLCQ